MIRKSMPKFMWMLLIFLILPVFYILNVSASNELPPDYDGENDSSITIIADKEDATVTVKITDSALDDRKISVICFNPQWDGTFTNMAENKKYIVYLNQYNLENGSLSIQFEINEEPAADDYSLVIGGLSGGKIVEKFRFTDAGILRLQELIEEAKKLDVSKYTADSFAQVVSALIDAALVDRNDAAAVKEVRQALKAAIEDLEENPTKDPIDLTGLSSAVDAALDKDASQYTPASYAKLVKALADAALADKDDQDKVDAATAALNKAIQELVPVTDTILDGLNDVVTEAKLLNADDYTPDSFKRVTDALAQAVSADKNNQTEVDNAASALRAAIDGLVRKTVVEPVDLEGLIAAVRTAQALEADKYTLESYRRVISALADVAAVDQNSQTAVDTAVDALEAAIQALVEKGDIPVDITKLNEAVTAAKALNAEKYTTASYAKVVAALANAVNTDKGSQTAIDKASKELKDAIVGLKLKPVTPPSAPVIKSAKSPSKGKVRVALKKKVANAKGYQICVSNKKTGKYTAVKTLTKATKLKIDLKKLKSGKTIYIKARAYRLNGTKKVFGKYSKPKRVKVK